MTKIREMIKRYRKEKSLCINILVFLMYKFKLCSKYTAGLVSMDRIYYKVEKKYRDKARIYASQCKSQKIGKMSKNVWVFWWQGIDNAPDLVKVCYDSVVKNFSDWNVIVIDKFNYTDFVQLPSSVIKKHESGVISHTHFSDILRLALLCEHGGVWLDATVYCSGEISADLIENDVFFYRNGWMDQETINFASWLIVAKANEPILSASLKLLYDYWENNNYLAHYFLLHMFVKMISDELKDSWNKIPYLNHNDNHLLAEELTKPFNRERINVIFKLTNFHKLTYKIDVNMLDMNTTYYNLLQTKIK